MSDAHAHTDGPDSSGAIRVVIEVGEGGVLKIQAYAPDENAVVAALATALATVKAGVDSEQCLH
jgi:hypothetical protein